MTKRPLVALLAWWLFASACGAAQATGPSLPNMSNVPNIGSVIQQMQPSQPISPAVSGVPSPVQTKSDAADQSITFRVTSIEITGNTRIATEQLHALVRDAEGQDLTLAALTEVVARITAHYQRHGFPLARAIVPGQTLVAGVVQVQVIEARYGAVVLVNQTMLDKALLSSPLKPLQRGQVIEQGPLDQALLLLSDIPGVVGNSILKRGVRWGETDLEVTATSPSKSVSGQSVIDNYGNAYLGHLRITQSLRVIDPFQQHGGSTLDLNGLTSGNGLNYGRVAYETTQAGAATRVGGAYSALRYTLGGPLATSGSYGDAQVAQLWVRRSLLRSYTTNVSAQLQYDKTQLRDHSGVDIDNNRNTNKISASLAGDVQDGLWFGAVNNWNLSLVQGAVGFDNAAAQLANAGHSEGRFSKVNAQFSRLQKLNTYGSLYGAMTLQWANRNLDSSEKLAVGGPNSVRASHASALSGDLGALLNLEYRHSLGTAWAGSWQLTYFFDSANVRLNQIALGANENRAHMSGAGVGLAWSGPQQILVKVQLAKLLSAPSGVADVSGSVRGWVEIARAF